MFQKRNPQLQEGGGSAERGPGGGNQGGKTESCGEGGLKDSQVDEDGR